MDSEGLTQEIDPSPTVAPYIIEGSARSQWYERKIVVIPAFGVLVLMVMAVFGALTSSGGNSYAGSDLEADVTRTIRDAGSAVSGVSCPANVTVVRGSITSCRGVVDGIRTGIRVTFDDEQGHFTLQPESLP